MVPTEISNLLLKDFYLLQINGFACRFLLIRDLKGYCCVIFLEKIFQGKIGVMGLALFDSKITSLEIFLNHFIKICDVVENRINDFGCKLF